jgi:CRISPR/Cas system endoribonuclease Cas6 (RAMP superfamily)
MGGVLGEIVLSGVDKNTYDLLKLGETIGVGKQTVFGLGKYKMEDIG